ncbi:MAG: ABC transporter ATPase [Flavobacteriaceae bacterium]|nr:ABC transporter ATPase [Flavobacteriaceae bacterium]
MYIEFEKLPSEAKVWVYQVERVLNEEEQNTIKEGALEFVNNWTRHGSDLKGSYVLLYNQFIVLGIDISFGDVSGCSIDSSVKFIKNMEKTLDLNILDKLNIAYRDIKGSINTVNMSKFKELSSEGIIDKDTVVFNNMVNTKYDLDSKWEVKVENSWQKRLL